MSSKYSFQVTWSDEDDAYIASCPEFPGLLAHGETPNEAIAEAQIALEGVIEVYKESDMQLPEPITRQQYSGQFRLRIPKSLHRQAAELAAREGVSLNTFIHGAVEAKVTARTLTNQLVANFNIAAGAITIDASTTNHIATAVTPTDSSKERQLPAAPRRDQ